MRFVINRVSTGLWNQREPACPGAVLGDVPGRPDLSPISYIELYTIEQVMALTEAAGGGLLFEADDWLGDGTPSIRIVDDYL